MRKQVTQSVVNPNKSFEDTQIINMMNAAGVTSDKEAFDELDPMDFDKDFAKIASNLQSMTARAN